MRTPAPLHLVTTMKKTTFYRYVLTLSLLTTGCSQSQIDQFQHQLLGYPESTQQISRQASRDDQTHTFSLPVGVDTAAMRLKQYYGFPSDADVAAARNNGQGNAGWSASAISEGASWSAQPGAYYRMSRNWAGNDRLTLEITGNTKSSTVSAIYRSSNPEHLTPKWTSRLWKQMPEVARGTLTK